MSKSEPADRKSLLKEALAALDDMQAKLAASERAQHEPIAVVGVGCRFPGGVTDPDGYWRLLRDGRDAVGDLPAARGADMAAGVPVGGYLDKVDGFDAAFFGISPREATTMDPQHRLLLEVVWEALERAGQSADRLLGSRTGVFVGITTSDYGQLLRVGESANSDVYSATGNALNAAAGRISFLLGLRGPTVSLDTACSSSLTAVHLACQSLRSGESRLAVACGVNIVLLPHAGALFTKWGMMAPDGRCKTFDAAADGFVQSEGCAALVLKRLSDAQADGDPVVGLVRGSAVNSDGRSSGLTVPNGPAQEEVIRTALASAKLVPAEIDYVEAHGTGTPLGDPIEAEALARVFANRTPEQALIVGSVKTNIGHAEAASGLAGLIKVLLALRHETIPPHLHFHTPSPRIDWTRSPLRVPTEAQPWRRGSRPRIAGVSSFGFSGTNAHVIVEEAPEAAPTSLAARPVHGLVLSAKSEAAAEALAGAYADRLDAEPEQFAALAATANAGRARFGYRLAAAAPSAAEMSLALRACAAGQEHPAVRRGEWRGVARPRVAWVFTGQGAQYVNMGRELFETDQRFRTAIERCAEILAPTLGRSLTDVLYPSAPNVEAAALELNQTRFTQPALFAVEYTLASLLRDAGLEPDIVLGHSIGEFVAAAVSGVYDVEAALDLVAHRARLMQALPAGGAMAAVFAAPDVVEPLVERRAAQVSIAAVNGPSLTVISGGAAAVAAICAELEQAGIKAQPLSVSHAFHSPLVEPMLNEFEAIASRVSANDPRVPLVSNVTATLVHRGAVLDGAYWRRHARGTVRFADSIAAAATAGADIVLEIGPHPALMMAGQSVPGAPARWLPTLRRGQGDWKTLLTTMGELFVAGVDIEWSALDRPFVARHVDAPTYPFERQRYWIEPQGATTPAVLASRQALVHPLLGRRLRSPGLSRLVFERELTDTDELCVREHKVFDLIVVPGAAYLEMGRAAGKIAAAEDVVVRDLSIREPLTLGPEGRILQTVLDPDSAGWGLQILSRPLGSDQDDWRLHASARVERSLVGEELVALATSLSVGAGNPVDREAYYADLTKAGVDYGPAFRGLDAITAADGAAGASLIAEDALRVDLPRFGVHPAILDSAFQLLGAALGTLPRDTNDASVYLPVAVDRFAQLRRLEGQLRAVARVRPGAGSGDVLTGDVAISTVGGEVVAVIEGLHCRRATAAALRRALGADVTALLHAVEWERVAPVEARRSGRRAWLLLADSHGVAAALRLLLEARGDLVTTVRAGESDSLSQRFESGNFTEIVHVWGLEASAAAGGSEQEWLVCGSLVEVVRRARQFETPPRLTIVTAAAQSPGVAASTVDPIQALAWGMGRTMVNEQQALSCRLVDLPPAPFDGAIVEALRDELDEAQRLEPQIALRPDGRWAPRLVRGAGTDSGSARLATPGGQFTLAITERGVIDNLRLEPMAIGAPADDEVQIEVAASGLNFRDVLTALGMYPGPALPLGGEVVGTVSAVGSRVTRFRTGDEVLALTPQGFCSFVNTQEALVWPRPTRMSQQDAATIPIVFHTAHYALHHVARTKPGERVLIHAGAGGVGIAAIQLAKHAGAEIFATAGSPEKRAFLRTLGVPHVFDSRTLSFADEIRALTMGEGIDVVLNSLAGEFIPRSLELLRAGGRFLELGKTDLWDQARAAAVNPRVRYEPIYLGDVCQTAPRLIEQMYGELMPLFESGVLEALPSRSYAIDEALEAFRFMAQARHTGKLVLWQQPAAERSLVRADGAYVVTGGLGGVGLHVARWLVRNGAGHVVLAGRNAASAAAQTAVGELRQDGGRVTAVSTDVTDPAAVAALIAAAESTGLRLRGIVHAAGVLDDGVMDQLTAARVAAVVRPKLEGGLALAAASRGGDLDFLLLCSAGAALFGPPGQASYAAANSGLDALAVRLRGGGVRAASVNWGAWKGTGMAGSLSDADRRRWADAGVLQIEPADAIAAMEAVIRSGRANVAVLGADWSRAAAAAQPPLAARLLTRLTRITTGAALETARAEAESFRSQLDLAPADEQREMLATHVRSQVRRVLGMPTGASIRADIGFADLGMDSLMSVELSNRLRESLACSLPATLAFEQPTLDRLVDFLARQVLTAAPALAVAAGPSAEEQARERLLVEVDELTDEQVEQSLAAELDKAGY